MRGPLKFACLFLQKTLEDIGEYISIRAMVSMNHVGNEEAYTLQLPDPPNINSPKTTLLPPKHAPIPIPTGSDELVQLGEG